jgi:hypothetical protein
LGDITEEDSEEEEEEEEEDSDYSVDSVDYYEPPIIDCS